MGRTKKIRYKRPKAGPLSALIRSAVPQVSHASKDAKASKKAAKALQRLRKARIHVMLVEDANVPVKVGRPFYEAVLSKGFFSQWRSLAARFTSASKVVIFTGTLPRPIAAAAAFAEALPGKVLPNKSFTVLGELEYHSRLSNSAQAVRKMAQCAGNASDLVVITHFDMRDILARALCDALGWSHECIECLDPAESYFVFENEKDVRRSKQPSKKAARRRR